MPGPRGLFYLHGGIAEQNERSPDIEIADMRFRFNDRIAQRGSLPIHGTLNNQRIKPGLR